MFISTKTYGPEEGFAVAYRQWKAESHCRLIHGYAMSFCFEFEAEEVDIRNWVVDYGSVKSLKSQLKDWFDHTLLVAQDDPEFKTFEELHNKGLCKMVVVERTGCEGLSKYLYDYVNEIWLPENGYNNVHCRKVRVSETPANMAWYECYSEEHDVQMKSIINDLIYQTPENVDWVETTKEVLSYVKRVKLKKNKSSVRLQFQLFCDRVAHLSQNPTKIMEYKNSV